PKNETSQVMLSVRSTSALRREFQEEEWPTLSQPKPDYAEYGAKLQPENQCRVALGIQDEPACDGLEELFLDRARLFNIEDDVLALVDPKFAKEQVILPIERAGDTVTVICTNKQAQRITERVLSAQHKTLRFKFAYSTEEIVSSAIDCHYLRR